MKAIQRVPLELIFWILALVLLGTAKPHSHLAGDHFTFCPLANLGVKWCPGCGIGRSITQLFHGNIRESIAQHWFGIPALLIILYRIVVLAKIKFNEKRNLI